MDGSTSPHGNPTYGSIMSYAYSDSMYADHHLVYDYLRFSPGKLYDRDNMNLDETAAVAPAGTDITFLTKFPYFFPADIPNRKVDWNRDGEYESSTKAMFGPVPLMWGIREDQLDDGLEEVTSTQITTGVEVVAFVRSGSAALYLFRIDSGGNLLYTYTTAAGGMGGWVTWAAAPGGSGLLRADGMPAAARTSMDGSDKLVVLAPASAGSSFYQWVVSAAGSIGSPTQVTPTDPAPPAGAIKDLSAVSFGSKVHAFYSDATANYPYLRAYMGTCIAPVCTWGTFSAMRHDTGQGAEYIDSKVTPAAAVGPNNKLYLLGSSFIDNANRLELYSSTTPETMWNKTAVMYYDEERGHEPDQLRRSPITSRPTMVFLNHQQGGSGTTPLASGKGYLMAWWNWYNAIRFFLTEGPLSPTQEGFKVGNFRYVYNGSNEPFTSTPSATVLNSGAHLIRVPYSEYSGHALHLPHADGLTTYHSLHKDTSDGDLMEQYICTSLKRKCTARCTTNRNASCSVPPPEYIDCPCHGEDSTP